MLEKAAKEHVDDIGPKGLFDFIGSDGSSPCDRIQRHGNFAGHETTMSVNHHDALNLVLTLLIDDGVPDRQNRGYLFSNTLTVCGVASAEHKFH